MNIADVIEVADRTPQRRALYGAALVATLAALIAMRAIKHGGRPADAAHSDFNIFYAAAKLVWQGRIIDAYDFVAFGKHQLAILGFDGNAAWTYPPPYNLVIAPLAAFSLPMAFAVFFAVTAAAYLWVLLRLAGNNVVAVLLLTFIASYGVVIFGQNGLLTGALVGLACIGLLERRAWAGVPLGLMIIKPHLAVGLAVHVVVTRQWREVAIAAVAVAAASALATAAFGLAIWPAFLAGARETGSALTTGGRFPLFRMVSPFAVLASLGLPVPLALAAQAVSALLAMVTIAIAARRLAVRPALGIAAIASLLISPYVYDYDLPIMGISLALLLPELLRLGRSGERSLIYALVLLISVYGLAMTARHNLAGGDEAPTVAGLGLLLILALSLRIVLRSQPVAVVDYRASTAA